MSAGTTERPAPLMVPVSLEAATERLGRLFSLYESQAALLAKRESAVLYLTHVDRDSVRLAGAEGARDASVAALEETRQELILLASAIRKFNGRAVQP